MKNNKKTHIPLLLIVIVLTVSRFSIACKQEKKSRMS